MQTPFRHDQGKKSKIVPVSRSFDLVMRVDRRHEADVVGEPRKHHETPMAVLLVVHNTESG